MSATENSLIRCVGIRCPSYPLFLRYSRSAYRGDGNLSQFGLVLGVVDARFSLVFGSAGDQSVRPVGGENNFAQWHHVDDVRYRQKDLLRRITGLREGAFGHHL